jgi:CRP/FNR family transcriptional regulator, anaerobic regulatory protein
MDYSNILKNISKHIALDERETDYFTSLLGYTEVSKKKLLLKEGDACSTITYVNTGALRAYYLDQEDNESIIMFALDDWWVTDMHAFVMEQPSMLTIDALEDSTIFQLKKKDLDVLYIKVPKFERFFRILMQNSYVREQLRVIQNLSLPAEKRYALFIKKYPQVIQRIPLKYIASYLGITPEFLSVIRKKGYR